MILLDFKISENPVIMGIREHYNNGFAGCLIIAAKLFNGISLPY